MPDRTIRIAIDIRKINEFGIGSYIWNLARNIAAIDQENQYLLIGSRRNFYELGPLPPNFRPFYTEGSSAWRDHGALPWALRRHKVDVLHVPHHEAPLWSPAKLLVTVHDCAHLLFPSANTSRSRRFRDYWRTAQVVRRANHILAVSNSTRDDLVNIFNIDPSRISVIYNALDDRFGRHSAAAEDHAAVLERYQIKEPFVLYAGRIRFHKNVHRLIEAFAVLKSDLTGHDRYGSLKLVIIGDELSRRQYLRLKVAQSGVQQDVRFFGSVPAPTLRVFYQSAALFAFPSLYEGFGLPPLEAMANGAPVLASNTSSLPEVLEDAALLVNPENVFEIARGMKTILSDEAMRGRFIEKGLEQVTKFSWQSAAERVVDAYERIAPKRASVFRSMRGKSEARDNVMESSSSEDSPRKRLQI